MCTSTVEISGQEIIMVEGEKRRGGGGGGEGRRGRRGGRGEEGEEGGRRGGGGGDCVTEYQL